MGSEIPSERLRVFLNRKSKVRGKTGGKMQPRRKRSENSDVKGNKQIGWTEAARLQVIEAVIRVEAEIFMEEKNRVRPTGGRTKWERIANQLSPELRDLVIDHSNVHSWKRKGFKCQRLFGNLLYSYRGIGRKRLMTPLVHEMMKKCEELRRSRFSGRAESSSNSGSNSWNSSSPSSHDFPLVSPTNTSSQNSLGNREYSSMSQFIETEKEQAGSPVFQDHIHHEKSYKMHGEMAEFERGRGAQTPAQTRGERRVFNLHSTRPQSNRASQYEKKTTLDTDTILHMTLDGPTRKLAQELCALSTWVNSELISEGRKVMQEMTSSAAGSAKWRKLHLGARGIAAEPFDYLAQRSLSSMIDNQIRHSFQKLRMRFAVEFKNTCVDLARGVLHAMEVS